jgi:uncharacterized protein (TIGR03083 family)
MSWVATEQDALVQTLRSANPDAATLCEGWDVRRLVAHLVQREQAPVAGLKDAVARKPPGQEPGRRATPPSSPASWPGHRGGRR